MKKSSFRRGLMATTTICGAVLSTMVGGILVATVATMVPIVAQAQDYTSGALVGTVTDTSGAPVANADVTLTSVARGQAVMSTTNENGQFSATGLLPGDYTVAVSAAGYSDFSGTAKIVISQEVRYSYALTATGEAPTTIVVKGSRVRQDFTKTTTGLTVDLDTLVKQQPIARNLNAVTLLAPTVTRGQKGNANLDKSSSFGGGSVAENAYYIDGLNITNPDTYVGGNDVPFDFYKTIEVKTGGYAAEYGRATGGVVNATTKSGTNDFMFAVHANYAPMELGERQTDTYAFVGALTKNQENSLSIEMGGPIIKDHLFAYGLYQVNDNISEQGNTTTATFTRFKNQDPFLGAKIDAYITPTQRLSLTYFDTTRDELADLYDLEDGVVGDYVDSTKESLGGQSYVLNYNGKVTDWFTVSAAYGDTKSADNFLPGNLTGYNVKSSYDENGNYTGIPTTISSNQPSAEISVDNVEREFYRLDGDLRFDLAGRHHLRFGYDHEKNTMEKISTVPGTQPVVYEYTTNPSSLVYGTEEGAGPVEGMPDPYSVLNVTYEFLGGNVSAENSAFYIQDSWDVTSNLNLQIGVRSDDFTQNNLSGQRYLNLTGNIGPRLGFSWIPDEDAKWKVYGSYGTNFIPPAMNLGYRGKDLYFQEYFAQPAGGWVIDPTTGLPASVGAPVPDDDTGYNAPCPNTPSGSSINDAPGLSSYVPGTPACAVYGNGSQEGATSKTSLDLKATQEDEIILGTTYQFNDSWSFGLSYINRDLKRISEDSDFQGAIISYLDSNNLNSSIYKDGTISNSYYVWNVGDHGVTVNLKQPLEVPGTTTGELESSTRTITLTADQLGHYHNPERNYQAVVFDWKRAFDGKWGLQGSYTWSRSYGNYEGTVKSEVGNSQQDDAGSTIAFDSPGFEDNATGLLPNDRTHTFKLWGSYAVTPSFMVGANILVQSPAHFSCLGVHPTDPYAGSYGPYSHYCGGQPAQQGKGNKGEWTNNLDVSLRYTVPKQYAAGGDLVLRADIFNLLDIKQITQRRLTYENASGTPLSSYGSPTYYNTPRYMRVGFDLSY